MDADIIKEGLTGGKIGRQIIVYNSTTSTNDLARLYARDKNNDGLVIFTEEQTAGKGRFDHKWLSPRSESILCSVLLTTNIPDNEILSMTVAVAVAETIGKIGRNHARIKWPNDILINGKKIAGILIETVDSRQSLVVSKRKNHLTNDYPLTTKDYCIIGIGINCHQKAESFPDQIRNIATSIDIENKSITDRNLIARRLLHYLDNWLQTAQTKPQQLIRQWEKFSIQSGHRITLLFNGRQFTGSCIGIDPQKGLILQLENGGVRFFDAAHSTIVK
jgi:BirA family transcriptional regulator, biotin operon repressor / biotin---[acetyl-CoA-carboxylase] ligase